MTVTRTTLSALVGAGLLASGGVGIASAETFKLTAGSSHPPIVPWAKALPEVVVPGTRELAAAAGHEIEWTEAYAGALYNFQNTLEGVEEGLADIGWVGTLWEPAKMPLQNVTYFAPFITNDIALLAEIGNRYNEEIPEAAAAWERFNQKQLGIFATEPYILITTKPVNKVEDLQGLKLYTPGAVARWVEGTGAVGVDGGLPVYYEGIQNGVTDGGIVPATTVIPFKLQEVAPFVTQVELGGAIAGALSMNLDTWNSLPPEMQAAFEEIGEQYVDFVTTTLIGTLDNMLAALDADPNVTLTKLPADEMQKWADAVPNIAGEWVESSGPGAREVLTMVMDAVRANGGTPLREWDKELN